jgi:small ligand-binding sensory domain FIST
VPANSVVQFHLRDAQTSAHDLERTLTSYGASRPLQPEAGALLFSCQGRGMEL